MTNEIRSASSRLKSEYEGLLNSNYPSFDGEFDYPEIERRLLAPLGEPNPVKIEASGAYNELISLYMYGVSGPVILTSYEAWHLMLLLNHWFVNREKLEDSNG